MTWVEQPQRDSSCHGAHAGVVGVQVIAAVIARKQTFLVSGVTQGGVEVDHAVVRPARADPGVDGLAGHLVLLAVEAERTVDHATDHRIALHCDLPRRRWPLGGRAEQVIELHPGQLRLTLRVRAAHEAMPVALGWHPWFARAADGDMQVRVDSDFVLATTDDLIPTGDLAPVRGDVDLRSGPRLGDRRLDHCYVGVRGHVDVGWPDLMLRIDLPAGSDTVVVHSPSEVCVSSRRPPGPIRSLDRTGQA